MSRPTFKQQVINSLKEPEQKKQTDKEKNNYVETLKQVPKGSYVYDGKNINKVNTIRDRIEVTEKIIDKRKGGK